MTLFDQINPPIHLKLSEFGMLAQRILITRIQTASQSSLSERLLQTFFQHNSLQTKIAVRQTLYGLFANFYVPHYAIHCLLNKRSISTDKSLSILLSRPYYSKPKYSASELSNGVQLLKVNCL